MQVVLESVATINDPVLFLKPAKTGAPSLSYLYLSPHAPSTSVFFEMTQVVVAVVFVCLFQKYCP